MIGRCLAASAVFAAMSVSSARAESIVVQSTTSTANSGLYDAILPQSEATLGIDVRVVAVGTGQAVKNAANCDGDVLLVHARAAEEAFVASGYGVARFDLMYNDFVLVGPSADPAGIAGLSDASDALAQLAGSGAVFVSRGDDSGTHKAELALWAETPDAATQSWYRELGAGMGTTLNAAVAMDAYTLTDRATWLSFGNRGDHQIVVEGDAALFNQYGVIAVSPEHCPRVRSEAAQSFVDWITGEEGQAAIAGFRVNDTQLFFPNASGN